MNVRRAARFAIALVPLAVVLGAYASTAHFFRNQYDDSYITYRYAFNLAEGHGLVFNAGERTDAASSLLYTLALALAWLLGLHNLELVGALLGCLALVAICVNVHWLAQKLGADPWTAAVCSLCAGLNGLLSGWTLSGMETLPWAASVLLALTLIANDKGSLAVVISVGVAALMRFEGIFLVVAHTVHLAAQKRSAKHYLAPLAVTLGFACVYVIKYAYYGVWISHAFQMKELAAYYGADPRELFNTWRSYASIPFALGLYGLIRSRRWAVLAYVLLSGGSLLVGPRSDWCRYSVHLLPICYAFAAVPLRELRSAHPRLGPVALALLALLMGRQAVRAHDFNLRNMTALAQHQICRRDLGRYVRNHVSPAQVVASADLGLVAYEAPRHRFLDLMALTSADVLKAYARGQNADQILIDKRVRYLADTFFVDGSDRLQFLLAQFPGVHGGSRFRVSMATPAYRCSGPDARIQFNLARIVLRVPEEARAAQ